MVQKLKLQVCMTVTFERLSHTYLPINACWVVKGVFHKPYCWLVAGSFVKIHYGSKVAWFLMNKTNYLTKIYFPIILAWKRKLILSTHAKVVSWLYTLKFTNYLKNGEKTPSVIWSQYNGINITKQCSLNIEFRTTNYTYKNAKINNFYFEESAIFLSKCLAKST